ncbi:MAG: MGH1-like glycoside hydrolase domain-containing protein [Isosphaeraceae bacterium]
MSRNVLWLLLALTAIPVSAADDPSNQKNVARCGTDDDSTKLTEMTATAIAVTIPTLHLDHGAAQEAFRIAIGDLLGNVSLFKDGLLNRPVPVILAGLHYDTPWTRDASINAWNGASLLMPEVARNTLLSVLIRDHGKVRIGGQYWDSLVWTTGAWNHYLYTGDGPFLSLALEATKNSLAYFEQTEFDTQDGLFRGPGWSDGVAAYPDRYGDAGGSSGILDWPMHNPDKVSKPGYGIPMKALSTNCLYYNAYVTARQMAATLKAPVDPRWHEKAARLRKAINARFWDESKGCYRFLTGPFGDCDHQEGLGSAYALLFGIADARRADSVFAKQHVTPAGLPCGWPNLPRYERQDGMSFGRHMGTVWPQIQGFWAEAAARAGRSRLFGHEFFNLASHAVRDKQFVEIYHPITGAPYGGLQEQKGQGIILWQAMPRQSWAASAYLRMVLLGLVGMRFNTDGIQFEPCVPKEISRVDLRNVRYRKMIIAVTIRGSGTKVRQCLINGEVSADRRLPANAEGPREVAIVLGDG